MWANAVIAGQIYDHKCITNHSASLGLMQTETTALECKILFVSQYCYEFAYGAVRFTVKPGSNLMLSCISEHNYSYLPSKGGNR